MAILELTVFLDAAVPAYGATALAKHLDRPEQLRLDFAAQAPSLSISCSLKTSSFRFDFLWCIFEIDPTNSVNGI